MEFIGIGVTGLLVAVGTLWGYIEVKRSGRTNRLIESLKQYNPLYLTDSWEKTYYRVEFIGGNEQQWQRAILLVTHKRIALYPFNPNDEEKVKALYTIQPHEIRGFWRPIKYMAGENTIWIHAEIGTGWQILKLRLYQYDMQKLVRALKEISTSEQVTAYRRRRPYIHEGLVTAFPAHQTITGAWELSSPVQLYLMPLFLVILCNNHVQEKINLSNIQDIGALKRMEGGTPEGLIRFFVDNELRAFAIDDYEHWAELLATASKRTLEEPVIRKRKSKDNDSEFDDWDD